MHARSPFLLPGLLAGLALWSGCGSSAQATPQAAAPASQPTLKVDTVEVKAEPMPRYLALTGTLSPLEDASVAAGAAGKVLSTDAERGQKVKKGEVLARLDARVASAQAAEAAAAADIARAQAQLSKSNCERSTQLVEAGGVAQSQHEQALANCKVSEAQVTASDARARLTAATLSDMTIRAPFDGVVAERHVSVGEFVTQATPVVTLVATGKLRLELTVPEASAGDVHVGQAVGFALSTHPSVRHEARVTYVGPTVRRGSRDVVVEALVDNAGGQLTAGAFVEARLQLDEAPVAVVPRSALRQDGGQARLFVVKDGRLEERLVQLTDVAGEKAGVLRGVKAGEKVVAQARPDLHDGAQVQ